MPPYIAVFLNRLLQLKSITLTQFKNYIHQDFRFTRRIVGISGVNGVGKTNLLDAIYYLCFTKSYFSRSDAQTVNNSSQGFRLEGVMEKDGLASRLVCILRETGKKEFLVDDEAYERFARHVGRFPCVLIAPDDVRIITEGSEERRRYMDALLSQLDAEYLQRLINYNKLLQQRNSYLKTLAERRLRDEGLLDVYDGQLVTDGIYIYERRKEFMSTCIEAVGSFYQKISGKQEEVKLVYESQLHAQQYPEILKNAREKDLALQRTTSGVHKDDIALQLSGQNFKNIASQGQRKSLLFALKLAEFTILKNAKGFAPLLLLDDVFEKLDAERMHNLLEWVCVHNDGQIFITDTHKERIKIHLDQLQVEFQLIELQGAVP